MKKNIIATFMVLFLLVGMLVSASKKAEAKIDWDEGRNYSNSVSSGIVILGIGSDEGYLNKLFYSDGTYKLLLENGGLSWYTYFVDEYGTIFFHNTYRYEANYKNYKLYYYNKDICSTDVQPLILDGKQLYADKSSDNVIEDSEGKLMFETIAYDDDSGTYSMYPPDFDTLKANFDALNPGYVNPPLPKLEESASPTPVNPSPTSGVPTVSTSPNPGTTSSPLTTVSPSPTPSSGSETTSPTETSTPSTSTKTTVKKSGNTVKVTKGGKTIAKVTFKKSTGVANFNGKKVKKVKQAFIIKKSYNYGYITKKGKFYVMKRTTKKKKGYAGTWTKAVLKGNLAVKLKYGSKTKNIIGL